jgi:hypothetical protein
MKTSAALLVLVAAATLTGAASASTTFYSNDFETGPLGPEWSGNSLLTHADNFTRFNGRYSGGWTELTLGYPNISQPGALVAPGDTPLRFTVTFDFYAIDSWDGDASYTTYLGVPAGPDWLNVSVNQSTVFQETFNNRGYTQTHAEPLTPRSNLGFLAFNDAIYRTISVDFDAVPGQPIVIRWQDSGLQGLADESWGIDNVGVSYTAVPAPASLALGAGGLALASRRRRR